MKNLKKSMVVMMAICMSSLAMFAQLQVSVTGNKNPVVPASKGILYEQINTAEAGYASQDFEDAYNSYDCQGADDFLVPPGELWEINRITAWGINSTTATMVNVFIFPDFGGRPGDQPMLALMGLTCTNNSADLEINIPGGLSLGPGHHWLSVQDIAPYTTNSQWFWQRTTTVYNAQAYWRNPLDGFGTGATSWTTLGDLGYPGNDFMFRLEGNSGPLPAAECQYRVDLFDTFGDGWNGCSIDVMVNGSLVLNNITLDEGHGPISYYFQASSGDMITTTFNPGSWICEPFYEVYNSEGNLVCAVPNNCGPVIPPGQLNATCLGGMMVVPVSNWALVLGFILILGMSIWWIYRRY